MCVDLYGTATPKRLSLVAVQMIWAVSNTILIKRLSSNARAHATGSFDTANTFIVSFPDVVVLLLECFDAPAVNSSAIIIGTFKERMSLAAP